MTSSAARSPEHDAALGIIERHVRGFASTSDEVWGRSPICQDCRHRWPCDVAVVAAALATTAAPGENPYRDLGGPWQTPANYWDEGFAAGRATADTDPPPKPKVGDTVLVPAEVVKVCDVTIMRVEWPEDGGCDTKFITEPGVIVRVTGKEIGVHLSTLAGRASGHRPAEPERPPSGMTAARLREISSFVPDNERARHDLVRWAAALDGSERPTSVERRPACPSCGYRCGCCCHCECQTPCPSPDEDGDCMCEPACHGGHLPEQCNDFGVRRRATAGAAGVQPEPDAWPCCARDDQHEPGPTCRWGPEPDDDTTTGPAMGDTILMQGTVVGFDGRYTLVEGDSGHVLRVPFVARQRRSGVPDPETTP